MFFLKEKPKMAILLPVTVWKSLSTMSFANLLRWKSFIAITLGRKGGRQREGEMKGRRERKQDREREKRRKGRRKEGGGEEEEDKDTWRGRWE